MTPERNVDELFISVLELAPAERKPFLEKACGDSFIRKEVLSLVDAYEQAGDFLEKPPVKSLPQFSDPLIGRTLGDFTLREKLDEGGFGIVYRAEQKTLPREAVVKVLNRIHNSNKELIERFLREAKLASRLEHPYTAHVYAFGAEDDGLLWIAMEMVHGTPFNQLLHTQGPMSFERFIPLLEKICEVVETAHEHGIVHRDLKPANIMVISRAGRLLPKLLDFGIAKRLENTDSANIYNNITEAFSEQLDEVKTIGLLGSAPYMPPEQWETATETDARSDVYALGILSFEAVAGRRPFNGGEPFSLKALCHAHKEKPFPLLDPSFPAALNEVFAKAAAKRPEDRYRTATEFAAAFKEAAGFIERPSLPQLDERLRETLLARAPQPIAETVASFSSARNAHQAREQALEILRVVSRYIGVVALACRTRTGSRNENADESIEAQLRKLSGYGLTEKEWLELAKELCRPFARNREAYPIPELASFFFEDRNSRPTKNLKIFASILKAHKALPRTASEKQVFDWLDKNLPNLNIFLQSISFLFDYQLTADREDGRESWMGMVRRKAEGGRRKASGAVDTSLNIASIHIRSDKKSFPSAVRLPPSAVSNPSAVRLPPSAVSNPSAVRLPPSAVSNPSAVRLPPSAVSNPSAVRLPPSAVSNPSAVRLPPSAVSNPSAVRLPPSAVSNPSAVRLPPSAVSNPSAVRLPPSAVSNPSAVRLPPSAVSNPSAVRLPPSAVLLDAEGNAVLSLHPLAVIAEPTPGAREELFFFECKGRYGAKLVALPHGFERLDETVWEWFQENFLEDPLEQPQAYQKRAPYIGLSAFTSADAELFFGRERETEAFLNRLRVQPLLVVVGPSGAGKSSFVQAGVLPNLPQDRRAITMRPGADPLAALNAKLSKELDGAISVNLREELEKNPEALGDLLRREAEKSSNSILLVVDQFEELFTLCLDQSERALFAEAIARAARSHEDPVRIVIVLRDDFLMRAKQLPGLRDRLAQALELLATPEREDLLRILTRPSERMGFEFEDEDLPCEIVDSVAEKAGALPLLAFTAAKLWEQRDRRFKRLLRKPYESIGGVGGALAQHAEAMLEQMTQEEQRIVRETFKQLVTSEGTRAQISQPELIKILGDSRQAEAVLEKLIASRLLTASEGDMENAASSKSAQKIEVVHEALLDAWPRLVKWRRDDMEGARLRDQLRAAARQWQERGRVKGLLWRDEALTEYRLWRSRYDGKLTETEDAFATAAVKEANSGKIRKRLAASVFISALIVALAALFLWNRQIKTQLLENYEERGRQELLMGNPLFASVYLSEAYRGGSDGPSLRFLLARAMRAIDAQILSLEGHSNDVYTASYSPDGSRILTAGSDGAVRIWNASSGLLIAKIDTGQEAIRSAEFSPDASRIAAAGADKKIKIWNAANGKTLLTIEGHTGAVNSIKFNSDGSRLVTASDDQTVKIWNGATGRIIASIDAHKGRVYSAVFSPDGSRILSANGDGTAKIWDAASGRLIASLEGHNEGATAASFSPDGSMAATASDENTAKLWDASTGKLIRILEGHKDTVNCVGFSPDGLQIITASNDSTVKIWSAGGKLLASFEGHKGKVYSAEFSPNGARIVTAGSDSAAKVWDAGDSLLSSYQNTKTNVVFGEFSPFGPRVITAANDYVVKVLDGEGKKIIVSLEGHKYNISSVKFSDDGNRIATASDDDVVKVWNAADGKLFFTIEGQTASFNRDGNLIVTANTDKTAKVWNGSSGKLIAEFKGHKGQMNSAEFSPDGSLAVTANKDKTAKIWRVSDSKPIVSLEGHAGGVNHAEFSFDGKRVLTASDDNTAKVWEASTGRMLLSLEGHKSKLYSAVFSPDGSRIATASGDRTVKIWDGASGKLLASFEDHKERVASVKFSPDGSRILTAGRDKSVKLWDVHMETRTPDEVAQAVNRAVPFRLDQGRLIPIASK